LFLITIGGVAGQCGTGVPLMGNLGARMFCGVGTGSVTCPVGSACLLPAGVCCPVLTVVRPAPPVTVISPPPLVFPPAPPLVIPGATASTLVVAKCQIGSPLTNAAGVELFCGPGPNHVDCPLGSRCVIGPNNVFTACCALAGSVSMSISPPAGSQMGSQQSQNGSQSSQPGSQPSQSGSQPSKPSQTGAQPSQTESQSSNESNSQMNTSESSQTNMSESSGSMDESMSNSTEMGPVRFLSLWLLEPTEALAMWAPPNGTLPASYTAEISYDGTNWRRLSLEEPGSTFATFTVTEMSKFEFRVTPEGGAPAMETYTPKPTKGKAKAGGKMIH